MVTEVNSSFEVNPKRLTRNEAVSFCHARLIECGLTDWHVRLNTDVNSGFLGMCLHTDKTIVLSGHHIDIHDELMIKNTINHEISHALVGAGHAHDETWKTQAIACGCYDTNPCSNLSLSPEAIDAIRSGATLELEVEETVIRTPKFRVTRLLERCPECGKVAVEKSVVEMNDIRTVRLECGHLIIKRLPKATPFHSFISADADSRCAHEWNHTFCTKCKAKRPYDFQVDGMRACERSLATNKGFGFFDEMGLGKTIQVFGYLKFHADEACPVLFIVKSGILFQFFSQSLIWLGDDWVGQVIRTSKDGVIPNLKAYFISYDMLVPKTRKGKNGKLIQQGFDIQKLIDRGIKTIVLDECQLIKNTDASRTQQVRKLVKSADKVIALSGTPWKNRGSEFYSVLSMMAPTKFPSFKQFEDRWVEYYWDGNNYKQGGIRNVPAFKEFIKDIVIRREYNEVMTEFPEVNRTLYYTDLDSVNQEMYDESVSDFVAWWNSRIIGGVEDKSAAFGQDNIIAKLARMRHILGLAKIPATMEFVEDYVSETERKLVLFTHHVDVAEILHDKLKDLYEDQMPVLRLEGGMDPAKRFQLQEEFNASPRALMVASTLAAGEGINLQTCADAVLVERQWNPANEDQAAPGRFKRIGQEAKQVNVTCITGYQTVDDILHGIVERKRNQFHKVHGSGDVPQWNVQDIMREVADGIVQQFNQKKKSNVSQFVRR